MADETPWTREGEVAEVVEEDSDAVETDGELASDRRKLARRKIKVKKIFAAEVQLREEPHSCFLHIHDLSEGGMRIHTDFAFPDSEAIPVKLYLDEPLDLVVEKIWAKELIGGMHVMGLKLNLVSQDDAEKIRGFLHKYSPENRRRAFRLERILVVEMVLGSTRQKFGVFTMDMSTTGMQITHDFPLPEDVDIPFRILLEYDQPAIEIQARVQWQKQNSFEQYLIGLVFTDISEQVRARIEDFIDANLAGTNKTGHQTFAPLQNFSTSDLGF